MYNIFNKTYDITDSKFTISYTHSFPKIALAVPSVCPPVKLNVFSRFEFAYYL